ncbi:magnesium transporter CorA family protein [Azotobacter salinestris]|uniref:magnesium transporter CorA family protein n=1 Tax=Azotobacter salinestris TaxID=69964 RepID=UPI001266A3CC|nr:magnesium transporter CorA family protein [Azotobacter salinestris]
MITYYLLDAGGLHRLPAEDFQALPPGVLWIDLLQPSREEELFLERLLGVDIPTREEMVEIEDSSRFYENAGTLYMTASLVSGISEQQPDIAEVTFVLGRQWLVTVRYAELSAFRTFVGKNLHRPGLYSCSEVLFAALIDSVVDRIADVLELLQRQLNSLSRTIFSESGERHPEKTDLQKVVKLLGRHNGLQAKLSESLLSIGRQISYVRQAGNGWLDESARGWLKAAERDVHSLSEYQAKMSGESSFLLEATLGLINIEQNSIIKVFSIAAVLFLPPTLVGTVYGMNFRHMPELEWYFGYPLALGMMVGSAALSYAWFKFKGWL